MDFGRRFYGHHSATDMFSGYGSAMDPEGTYESGPTDSDGDASDLGLGVADIGMSVPLGIAAQNVAGVYSKIRMGAGNLEIQFAGYRSGQRNAQTPEQYGEDQRQAFREMSMANDVDFTTHASFSMMGMLGKDQYGNFSNASGRENLDELKKAIDFQADIADGGSVVMHTGEFDRPITDMTLDDENEELNLARADSGRLLFRQYNDQERASVFSLMDDRSSQVQKIYKDKLVSYPVWNRAKEDQDGFDQDGNAVHIRKGDYITYDGEKITNPFHPTKGRVPEQLEDGRFKIEKKGYDYFRQEAQEYNEWFEQQTGKAPDYYQKRYAIEGFGRASIDLEESYARGWGLRLGADSQKEVEKLKEYKKALKFYEDLEKSGANMDDIQYTKTGDEQRRLGQEILPRKDQKMTEAIKDAIKDIERGINYNASSAFSMEARAENYAEDKEHLVHPIKRLEKWGIRNYAEAGIHAMRRSKDRDNPLTVTVEHIFPEQFGGHPEELKWIIKKSRERMVDLLTQKEIPSGESLQPWEWDEARYKGDKKNVQQNPFYKGISRSEAEKIAASHLKTTIDTGHINLWRKYWQEDPTKSPEQNDKDFRQWAVQSIESLAKEGMVGNLHLADNYGYADDHLAPGQGNSPVKEIVTMLKKNGYDKAITVEPGADASTDLGDFHGLMKTWRFFGSSMYGAAIGGSQGGGGPAWGDVQNSYFGQNKPPYFIFGNYAPSNDWSLWSQVPME